MCTDGTQFNERLLIYCDGQVTPFANSFGGHGLVSAVVVDDSLYYTDSYGSGREFSQIGRVSLEGRKIRIVESAVYDITAVPGADLFVKEVDGRIRVEVGKFVAFNSWKEGRQVGWVTSEGSSLRIVDAHGATSREKKSNKRLNPPRSSEAIRLWPQSGRRRSLPNAVTARVSGRETAD